MIFLAIGLWILLALQVFGVVQDVYERGKRGKAVEATITVLVAIPLVVVVILAALVIGGLV